MSRSKSKGYQECVDYICAHHKEKFIAVMAEELGRSGSFVWTICLRQGLVPRTLCNRVYKARTKKPIRDGDFEPDDTPVQIVRPRAVYDNTPSPFGIADELHQNNLINK